jgi:hypothetical protein
MYGFAQTSLTSEQGVHLGANQRVHSSRSMRVVRQNTTQHLGLYACIFLLSQPITIFQTDYKIIQSPLRIMENMTASVL